MCEKMKGEGDQVGIFLITINYMDKVRNTVPSGIMR